MLNAKAFSNATTLVVVIFFVICRLIAWLSPDFLFQIGQSWFHTIQLESGQTTDTLSLSALLLGLISAAVLTWIMSYATIVLYNKWSEK